MKYSNVLVVLFVPLLLLAGCQPTPKKAIVQSKADGELQRLINSAPMPVAKYMADSNWKESIEGLNESLSINVDAKISIPEGERYPVYRIYPDQISQKEADAFFNYFIGSEKTYDPDTLYTRTKSVIQDEILMYEEWISNPNSQLNTDTKKLLSDKEWNEYVEMLKQDIERLQEEYKHAPTEATLQETSRTFFKYNAMAEGKPSFYMYKAGGITVKDNAADKYAMIYKDTEENILYQDMQYSAYGSFHNYDYGTVFNKTENLNNFDLSYDEAKKYADEVIASLGYNNYTLNKVFAAPVRSDTAKVTDDTPVSELPQGYVFTYTPQIDGIELTYYRLKQEVYWQIANEGVDSGYWTPPCIQITVDNNGIALFNKISAFKIDRKLNDNVKLIDFEQIKDIFRKYIVMKTDFSATIYEDGEYMLPTKRIINITDIKLGYMFTKERNSDAYISVPVFMFFGNEINIFKDQAHSPFVLNENNEYRDMSAEVGHSFLTINAIDGSIVDMSLGY